MITTAIGIFCFFNHSNELSCAIVESSSISYIKRKYNNIIKFYSVTEKRFILNLRTKF